MSTASTPDRLIPATLHPSGFERADSNFYSLSAASDGRLYYTLCSHNISNHGRVYRYDPAAGEVRLMADLGDVTGESGKKTIPQGKSHSPFFECDGKIYTATQYGYFQASEDHERPAGVPEGYRPYPGGHFVACDLRTGGFTDLCTGPAEDGILAMTLDPQRGRLYGLTWPRGYFLTFDLATRQLRNLGPVSRDGEMGQGERYFCLCRALGLHRPTGDVYFTNSDGQILRYRLDRDRVEGVEGVSLRRDIFGHWDPHVPGHQGYNWRDLFWHEAHRVFYGIHPRSAWLFRFDPAGPRLELIERLAADERRRSGGFELFRYGYLTLRLGPDGQTIYYLTGASDRPAEDGTVKESTHLVTYNLATGHYADHGSLRLPGPRQPLFAQTLAFDRRGRLYACPWIEGAGQPRPDSPTGCSCDLISFPDPLAANR